MQESESPPSSSSLLPFTTSCSSSFYSDDLSTPTSISPPSPSLSPSHISFKPSLPSAHKHGIYCCIFSQKPRSHPSPPNRIKRWANRKRSSSDKKAKRAKKSKAGEMCCTCLASTSADCAAICCCPLILLQLLIFLLFRAPAAITRRVIAGIKRNLKQKTKCPDTETEDEHNRYSLSPCWIYMEHLNMVEAEDKLGLEFKDESMLREYFNCHQLGFGGLC